MAWCKLHTDILADPKLMRAARRGARGLVLLPWLIAFAKAAEDEGRLTVNGDPVEPVDVSDVVPGTTPDEVEASLASLVSLGILEAEESGVLRFATWGTRQAKPKPSDEKPATRERQRKHRERRKGGHAKGHAGVTPTVTPDVTPAVTRDVTPTEEKRGEGDEKRAEQLRAGAREAAATALSGIDALRIDLTVAANNAITAKWGEQATPLYPSSAPAYQLGEAVRDAGIPLDFACETIRDVIARLPQKPSAMSYFKPALLEAWQKAQDVALLAARGDAPAPTATGVARATELWRILRATGLHRAPIEQREGLITQYAARGSIPDERAFRRDWGMVHLAAATLVSSARDDGQIVRALWAVLLTGKTEPYPDHLKHHPHPWLDWQGHEDRDTPQPSAA